MERVYIVAAEAGSYEDRKVWVCGVYLTPEEANKAVEEEVGRANAWRAWDNRRWRIGHAIQDLCRMDERTMNPAFKAWLDKVRSESDSAIGPEPPKAADPGENYYVAEVPVGQWGMFSIDDEG